MRPRYVWLLLLVLGAFVGLTHPPDHIVSIIGIGWWGLLIWSVMSKPSRW